MNYTEFYTYARGHKGAIYTARRGTVMSFVIDDGHTYLLSTTASNGKVIIDPVKEYWCNSIDFAGSFGCYFTYGVVPLDDDEMPYQADPIVKITPEQRKKLARLS